MEVDALVLIVVVISVALTTFVFTILGKYCYEKFFSGDNHSIRRIQRRRSTGSRSRTTRKHFCSHCHHCPAQVANLSGVRKNPTTSHPNQQVAINVGRLTDDLKGNTFAQLAPPAAGGASDNPSETFARLGMRSSKDGKAFDLDRHLQIANTSSSEINLNDLKVNTFAQLAPPAAGGASDNPSETFARLGIRSSKDGKAFDLDRQLQIANTSSSEINLNVPQYVPTSVDGGIQQYLRQINLAQEDSSYRHYEEVKSATVRDPGDGQQKDDDDDLVVLEPNESNIKKKPKTVQDQVSAGSSGLNPFKGVTLRIYDEVSKLPSDRVDKPSGENPLSESLPSLLSTSTIATETKTTNNDIYTKSEESMYEKPIEVYDLKPALNHGGGNNSNGTVDNEEGNEDAFPLTPADLKRFSYPRPSNHCPTCSCQHYVVTDALLLKRKIAAEEMFEEESAQKNVPLNESVFQIKTKGASVPDKAGQRKLLDLQFNDKPSQDLE